MVLLHNCLLALLLLFSSALARERQCSSAFKQVPKSFVIGETVHLRVFIPNEYKKNVHVVSISTQSQTWIAGVIPADSISPLIIKYHVPFQLKPQKQKRFSSVTLTLIKDDGIKIVVCSRLKVPIESKSKVSLSDKLISQLPQYEKEGMREFYFSDQFLELYEMYMFMTTTAGNIQNINPKFQFNWDTFTSTNLKNMESSRKIVGLYLTHELKTNYWRSSPKTESFNAIDKLRELDEMITSTSDKYQSQPPNKSKKSKPMKSTSESLIKGKTSSSLRPWNPSEAGIYIKSKKSLRLHKRANHHFLATPEERRRYLRRQISSSVIILAAGTLTFAYSVDHSNPVMRTVSLWTMVNGGFSILDAFLHVHAIPRTAVFIISYAKQIKEAWNRSRYGLPPPPPSPSSSISSPSRRFIERPVIQSNQGNSFSPLSQNESTSANDFNILELDISRINQESQSSVPPSPKKILVPSPSQSHLTLKSPINNQAGLPPVKDSIASPSQSLSSLKITGPISVPSSPMKISIASPSQSLSSLKNEDLHSVFLSPMKNPVTNPSSPTHSSRDSLSSPPRMENLVVRTSSPPSLANSVALNNPRISIDSNTPKSGTFMSPSSRDKPLLENYIPFPEQTPPKPDVGKRKSSSQSEEGWEPL